LVSDSATAQAAGGWLCPLLDKARPAGIFLLVDIREPVVSFAQRNIAFRKQFQPNKHFQTYYLIP